jgi:hypothetical protein
LPITGGEGVKEARTVGSKFERRCYFGDVARVWGFASAEQVLTALNVQRARTESGLGHRFIGDVMVDLGLISDLQRNEILQAQSRGTALQRAAYTA